MANCENCGKEMEDCICQLYDPSLANNEEELDKLECYICEQSPCICPDDIVDEMKDNSKSFARSDWQPTEIDHIDQKRMAFDENRQATTLAGKMKTKGGANFEDEFGTLKSKVTLKCYRCNTVYPSHHIPENGRCEFCGSIVGVLLEYK